EHFGEINFMKGGIIFADQVTTVSPTYTREIQGGVMGAGLDGLLRSLSWKLTGILNGIDMEQWNPATDKHLPASYDRDTLGGKEIAKRALVSESGLRYQAGTPLIGAVSRLVEQKGFQLLTPILPRILQAGAQFVLLGSGESHLEREFQRVASEHREACSVTIGFDNALAHRIYAGCDMLLVPSLYEPCGLSQMYALRYGTLPVVRLTGGLADTVIPYDGSNAHVANGFGFVTPSPADLYAATWTGILNFKDSGVWRRLQQNGMRTDFSWDRSAREYEAIYRRAASAA
ncbi:MAG TPA: glycogen/starch synthase, partial [Thermoanaerobaculia bacterium]|nr:glycogen/starch synthase [Thermoanaerobaculia bacterium]